MNKGVIRATGDYILFLGSDDVFCNDMVISDAIADLISVGCPDLWCGRMRLIDYQSRLFKNVGRALSKRDILAGVMANHPAMLVKRYLLIEHPFDLNFKIAADQEFFVWCCNTGKKIAFSDICLVDFNTSGVSSFSKKALNESRMIVRKYAPRFLKAFDRRTRKNYFMSYLIPILTKLRLLRVFRENTGWKKM